MESKYAIQLPVLTIDESDFVEGLGLGVVAERSAFDPASRAEQWEASSKTATAKHPA